VLRQYDERRFPVRTPELSPGNVASRPLPASLRQVPPPIPFFIVGTDALSTHWLITWRARLRELGASGLVVEASDKAAFDALAQAADGLPLALASGTAIARVLGLTHYPVLVSREGIEQ
jgi:integrating conjugative element protein (TIGR03765 family)